MKLVDLAPSPVRVSAVGAPVSQELRLAVDVSDFSMLDLELTLLDDGGGGTAPAIRLLTGMRRDTEDGWVEVDSFVASSAPATLKKTFFPLLRYARWEVTAGTPTFVLRGVGHQNRPFLPTDIDSCVVWLRSDSGITLSGGNVSAWADKSGNGNHVAQGTSSKQPSYHLDDVNGHPSIQFDGSNDNLKGTLAATLTGTGQDFTIFVVANVDSTTSGGSAALYELSDSLSVTNRGPMLFYEFSPTSFRWRCFQVSAQASYSNPPFDSWHWHHGWHETAERRVYLDGVHKATGTTSASSRDLTVHSVGLLRPDGSPALPLKGKIAEIVAYHRKLTDDEQQRIGAYFEARYGL